MHTHGRDGVALSESPVPHHHPTVTVGYLGGDLFHTNTERGEEGSVSMPYYPHVQGKALTCLIVTMDTDKLHI